ncbi:Polyribonucleotide nucleotidyltransferase domain-containing protein [Forsythia ovata]|uniref:Polyribonucleotide nucleotidyltransferase domain-containing protein n=1 Tax=Forsythia ovata TaxID=205694 RepID=A0ABD1W4B7_9LAMI
MKETKPKKATNIAIFPGRNSKISYRKGLKLKTSQGFHHTFVMETPNRENTRLKMASPGEETILESNTSSAGKATSSSGWTVSVCCFGLTALSGKDGSDPVFLGMYSSGTRSARINAANLSVVDDGIPKCDVVTSSSAGYVNSTPLLDADRRVLDDTTFSNSNIIPAGDDFIDS